MIERKSFYFLFVFIICLSQIKYSSSVMCFPFWLVESYSFWTRLFSQCVYVKVKRDDPIFFEVRRNYTFSGGLDVCVRLKQGTEACDWHEDVQFRLFDGFVHVEVDFPKELLNQDPEKKTKLYFYLSKSKESFMPSIGRIYINITEFESNLKVLIIVLVFGILSVCCYPICKPFLRKSPGDGEYSRY